MLRNRSRSVTSSKQSLMADNNSITCPRPNQTTSISSFFGSPRFFNGFFMNGVTKFESLISPTSIFSTKKIPNFVIPFGYYCDQNHPKTSKIFNENNQRIGLALIVALVHDEKHTQNFGFTQKKIQIPIVSPSAISPTLSPKSPTDFGIKTRNSQFLRNLSSGGSSEIFTRSLSLREMELSEEYTCVISHGPNPKTTRIFDNCILQSCCGVEKEYNLTSPSKSFLSFCHTCKKNLGEGNDINMYRGEKAFCSSECRCEEMLLDGLKNSEINNGF